MLPYQYETNIFMPNLKRKKINWDYGKQRTILLHGNGENTPEKVTGQNKKQILSEILNNGSTPANDLINNRTETILITDQST